MPNGKHLIKPKHGLNPIDGNEFPNVIATCYNGWTIIDPNQDSNFQRYFSSFQYWTDYAGGPSNIDHVTWKQWWLPSDDNTQFSVSPDCQTCIKSDETNATYYMTGNYFGCLWNSKGYCDMNPNTLQCYQCKVPANNVFEKEITMDGLCTHLEMNANRTVVKKHKVLLFILFCFILFYFILLHCYGTNLFVFGSFILFAIFNIW